MKEAKLTPREKEKVEKIYKIYFPDRNFRTLGTKFRIYEKDESIEKLNREIKKKEMLKKMNERLRKIGLKCEGFKIFGVKGNRCFIEPYYVRIMKRREWIKI